MSKNISQENILRHEQNGQHIHQGLDLFALAADHIEQHIGHHAEGDALRDGISWGFEQDEIGEEFERWLYFPVLDTVCLLLQDS